MSSYLSDLEHKRIEARVHKDRVTETYYISDSSQGARRKAQKKTWKVERIIGSGTFGEVRLEVCDEGKERAVKKIRTAGAALKVKECEKELKALLEFSKPKVRYTGYWWENRLMNDSTRKCLFLWSFLAGLWMTLMCSSPWNIYIEVI